MFRPHCRQISEKLGKTRPISSLVSRSTLNTKRWLSGGSRPQTGVMTHHIGRTKKTIRNSKRKRWIFEEKKINDFPFCPKGGNLGGNAPNNEMGGGDRAPTFSVSFFFNFSSVMKNSVTKTADCWLPLCFLFFLWFRFLIRHCPVGLSLCGSFVASAKKKQWRKM